VKTLIKISGILLALLLVGPLFAQEEDEDAPAPWSRRGAWSPLNNSFSIGLFAAYHFKTTVEFNGKEAQDQARGREPSDTYFGLGVRFYPFLGGKLGVGIDMMLLDRGDFQEQWLADLDVLLRFSLIPELTVNGGIGWSQYLTVYDFGTDSHTEWGKVGVNVKVGAEYFLTRNFSVSGDFKWTTFKYDFSYEGALVEKFKFIYFTFQLGIHYWL